MLGNNHVRPFRCGRIRTAEMLSTASTRVRYVNNTDLSQEVSARNPSQRSVGAFQIQCPTGVLWTIQPGDTLFNIALITGVTVEQIVALNPGIEPENLQPGTHICLPLEAALPKGPIPPCASGLYWVVARGDTLFSIAQAYGTTVERLLELNPGIDPGNLQIGMSICLPG